MRFKDIIIFQNDIFNKNNDNEVTRIIIPIVSTPEQVGHFFVALVALASQGEIRHSLSTYFAFLTLSRVVTLLVESSSSLLADKMNAASHAARLFNHGWGDDFGGL